MRLPTERLRGREIFDGWKRQVKSLLVMKGCWKIVETGLTLAEITLMVDPCNYGHFAVAKNAKEVGKRMS